MKLRNKITGEINIVIVDEDYFMIFKDDGEFVCTVTLKELNEGWEDVPEEPKEYYWIDYDGKVKSFIDLYEWQDKMKEIGNYFETKEEAEKAVEKLKAWKRLKDGGFYFTIDVTTDGKYSHNFILRLNCTKEKINKTFTECEQYRKDLHLLFGGEE